MADKVKACIQASKYLDENSRYEMLDVLTHLEGEIQAKDVTIAALKSECLKHVIYSIQASNKPGDILTDPLFALGRDAVNIISGPNPPSQSTSACKNHNNKDTNSSGAGSLQSVLNKESDAVTQHVAHKIKVLQTLVDAQKSALKKLTTCLREAESQKTELMKDLEEERKLLEKEVSKNEAVSSGTTSEHNHSPTQAETDNKSEDLVKLESQVEELQKKLAEEATAKKQITLLLLEDRKKMATLYLEEKKRSEDLNHLLREEKSKVHSLGIGLEEESQRSLAMEAELERYLVQINGQAEELAAARATRQDLEEALRRARADSDHFKKQLTEAHRVAMSQATVAASLVAVMPNNPAQAFSDGPSTLSNMDGNNPSVSSGMYGKWGVSSSATLPSSSSAGVGISSSATSAAATMAVGSMTLGTGSQMQSTQGVGALYDKDGHIMGSGISNRQAHDYSSSATMIPRQHRTGIGGLNTTIQSGPGSSIGKSDMSSSSMTSSSVLSGDSMLTSSSGVSSTMSSGSGSGRIINISSSKLSGPPSLINNSSSGTKGGTSSIMHNVISSGGGGIGKLSVSSSTLKASASSSTSTSIGNKGMPPPIPPNKPAMSALYKPITTALKSIGGGGGGGNNDHQQTAGMTVGDTKNN